MSKLYFCGGCSFKCQATECDCICHTKEWQLGFVAGQKQKEKEILGEINKIRKAGWGFPKEYSQVTQHAAIFGEGYDQALSYIENRLQGGVVDLETGFKISEQVKKANPKTMKLLGGKEDESD